MRLGPLPPSPVHNRRAQERERAAPLFQLIGNLVDSGLHAFAYPAIVESVCAIGGFFRILRETPRVDDRGIFYAQGLCLGVVWCSPLGMLCNSETQRV
jgi:hypothetical protein